MDFNFDIQFLNVLQQPQFNKILQNDEVLNDLQKEKNNQCLQYLELMSFVSKRLNICGLKVIPFTPVIVSFLYAIDNRFFNGKKEQIRKLDIDVVMYILTHGIECISQDLIQQALEFCAKNNINYQEAHYQILTLIALAFRPLEMIPYGENEKSEIPHYNLDWLTRIVSIACMMTNKTSDQIAFNMSLTEIYSYIIQYMRKNDTKNEIKRRNSIEIDEAMYLRTIELGKKYLESKKGVKNGNSSSLD